MKHIPVLLHETIQSLNLSSGKHVIDCTLGDAGHAEEILKATAPNGKLLGIDADAESLLRAKQFLYQYEDRVTFMRSNFLRLRDIVSETNFGPINGILFDLGWSSPQFEERGRGFSFQKSHEPLDMRYDMHLPCKHTMSDMPTALDGSPLYGPCTAAEMVNTEPVGALARIFREYGEERYAALIAEAIEEKRNDGYVFETVDDLVSVILSVYRKKLKTDKDVPWVGGLHPATKVFQALRIAVNDELGVLEAALRDAVSILAAGGRIAVISFHSIEDRIVKHFFKSQKKVLSLITKKPITASPEEYAANPRARSAKLRVAEHL